MFSVKWMGRLLFRIAPLLTGFALGFSWFWVRGDLFALDSLPEGYSWSRYLLSAWGMHHEGVGMYNGFREPGYFWMLSILGDAMNSYTQAGLLISSCSMLVLLICAGCIGYFFGGPWVAMGAMIALPWVVNTVDAPRWVNNYPMQAAFYTTFLTLGLYATQKRSFLFVVLGALCFGLSFHLDLRTVFFAPAFLLLVAYGLYQHHRTRYRNALIFLVATTGSYVWGSDVMPPPRAASFVEKQAEQQAVTRRWQKTRGVELQTVCEKIPLSQLLTPASVLTNCGKLTLTDNLRRRVPLQLPFGQTLSLLALLLVLLLWSRRVEYSLLFGGVFGPMGVWMALTPFPERYMLLYAFPLACLVPCMVGVLFSKELHRMVVCALLLFWAWEIDFCRRDIPQTTLEKTDRKSYQILGVLRQKLQTEELFLDCSRQNLEVVFAPHTNHMQLLQNGRLESYCVTYMQQKDAVPRWLLLNEGGRWYPSHNGWEEVQRWGETVLWYQRALVKSD